jgi:hypothetical protein
MDGYLGLVLGLVVGLVLPLVPGLLMPPPLLGLLVPLPPVPLPVPSLPVPPVPPVPDEQAPRISEKPINEANSQLMFFINIPLNFK